MKLPELLSPAGSPESLKAALDGGADAVYFGAGSFNCRLRADNFDDGEIRAAIDLCRRRGVKSYITLNTKIKDIELDDAVSLAVRLAGYGADAFIVSDLGLSRRLRSAVPGIELHGSTQLTANTSYDAELLRAEGYRRVVSAREMSRGAIARLAEASPIGIEIFVHGAHCASVSGQCLASFALGGRSGNRGECAQPCRHDYKTKINGKTVSGRLLGMRDMCLGEHIPEIISLGVESLKLEGRLKSPSYVRGATEIYRRLLDEGRAADKNELARLNSLFPERRMTDFYFASPTDRGFGDSALRRSARLSGEESELCKPEPESIRASADFLRRSQVTRAAALYFDRIYLPLGEAKRGDAVTLPPYLLDGDMPEVLEAVRALHPSAVEFHTPGQLIALKNTGTDAPLFASFRLNVFNSDTAAVLAEHGAEGAVLSPELPRAAMRGISFAGRRAVTVYGRLPMMMVSPSALGIPQSAAFTDRRGERLALLPAGDFMSVLYNPCPIYTADTPKALAEVSPCERRFTFTAESPDEVDRVIEAYKKHLPAKGRFRRL